MNAHRVCITVLFLLPQHANRLAQFPILIRAPFPRIIYLSKHPYSIRAHRPPRGSSLPEWQRPGNKRWDALATNFFFWGGGGGFTVCDPATPPHHPTQSPRRQLGPVGSQDRPPLRVEWVKVRPASIRTILPVSRDSPVERKPVLARVDLHHAAAAAASVVHMGCCLPHVPVMISPFCKLGRQTPLLALRKEDHHPPQLLDQIDRIVLQGALQLIRELRWLPVLAQVLLHHVDE